MPQDHVSRRASGRRRVWHGGFEEAVVASAVVQVADDLAIVVDAMRAASSSTTTICGRRSVIRASPGEHATQGLPTFCGSTRSRSDGKRYFATLPYSVRPPPSVTGATFRRTAQIFQECDGVFRDFRGTFTRSGSTLPYQTAWSV